mmetsp:Transcript_17158/g.30274  ORF Transcript_17158/g.30274 Transcript_17158/m.30274 type:complete len:251 (-) Transcript_17158:236-988(-)
MPRPSPADRSNPTSGGGEGRLLRMHVSTTSSSSSSSSLPSSPRALATLLACVTVKGEGTVPGFWLARSRFGACTFALFTPNARLLVPCERVLVPAGFPEPPFAAPPLPLLFEMSPSTRRLPLDFPAADFEFSTFRSSLSEPLPLPFPLLLMFCVNPFSFSLCTWMAVFSDRNTSIVPVSRCSSSQLFPAQPGPTGEREGTSLLLLSVRPGSVPRGVRPSVAHVCIVPFNFRFLGVVYAMDVRACLAHAKL